MNAIYLRASITKLGKNDLCIEAQRAAILARGITGKEFVEVESGRKTKRPQLSEAVKHVKKTGGILYIAKLDRLSQNVDFIFRLKRQIQNDVIRFEAIDLPDFNTLTFLMFAKNAQFQQKISSFRTKEALEALRQQRGEWRKGNESLKDSKGYEARSQQAKERKSSASQYAHSLRMIGCSLNQIASKLMEAGYKTPATAHVEELNSQGKEARLRCSSHWSKGQVSRLLASE
jgi:DNA invertase Pin-like site-specific DNA recombinase